MIDMVTCRNLSSDIYPNRRLCEWYVRKTSRAPETLDTGETYVDLNDPLKPEIKRKGPDQEISPRELHGAVTQLLEEEWKKFLANQENRAQPLAEDLYDRFKFVPPWLPKPLSRMDAEEKNIFQKFLVGALGIRYDPKRTMSEDRFLEILKAGAASCVGISNLAYFKERIVNRREVQFIEVYRDQSGEQHPHFGIAIDGKAQDPSNQRLLPEFYTWFPLDPMDQWALSLMNAGLDLNAKDFMKNFGLRVYQLAPDYFRVRFNLGDVYYEGGQKEMGIRLLRGASELYPTYHKLEEWKKVLTKD